MKFWLVVFLSLIPLESFVQAEEPQGTLIKKGAVAPYDGLLLNSAAQIKMIADKAYAQKEYELKLSYELMKQKAVSDLEIGKLKIDVEIGNKKFDTIMKIKDDELKRSNELVLQSSKKSDRWIWWLIGGFVVGTATAVGITYAVNH